ncbi:hypothetical protein N7462_001826 [Penicillium macrosclerotiorum]|uniref:uncharacterized protein n=1 Tax=Penicillium macrosclerotiorum TaxID=303699 RepID=UPI0025494F94|nr:uncharacterized protein N7462_001826 [Penicillium macrosclerotiorum]KAJ5692403.1 hypothetical protein N7462_001826 [Penicillium macrosclerotiorum]
MDPDASVPAEPAPSVFNYVLSFLLVGVAWGFTTPFIRRAAADFNARQEKQSADTAANRGRSQTQSSPQPGLDGDGQEEQELLDRDEDEEGVRRRSSSQQRLELDNRRATGRQAGQGPEDETEDAPAPVWMRSSSQQSWLRAKIVSLFWTVVNLLRTPAYSIPLVINLTGSIWFFLLVGQHELSLTVPLANSSAFMFTVLGEWYVEKKVIAKETWLGLILVLGGIALCVHSKNQTG